jgi:Uncharacterized alpha/beta hydrolase domain (DUF2235)
LLSRFFPASTQSSGRARESKMAKNIIIFSDGTGQVRGITFDEIRTNVYKLYRGCRVGPDSSIDPAEQVAFYDPGLGSSADGGHLHGTLSRQLYNLASKATGLGITANIVDCYAALIRLYRDEDRIFLIGFSRSAYTVRSLAAVVACCGIPRHLPGGGSLPMDVKGSTSLAETAVKSVYQFCSSYDRSEIGSYLRFMMDTRDRVAAKFRDDHGCSNPNDENLANAYPYFIGVFDTVAALGHKGLQLLTVAAVLATPVVVSFFISLLSFAPHFPYIGRFLEYLTFWNVLYILGPASLVAGIYAYLKNYLKAAFGLPGYGIFKSIATIHFTRSMHQFYDQTLNANVGYAKHAISIDENRADFRPVEWKPTASKAGRDAEKNLYFEQVHFPGVHADIGGGYNDNESRLSDIALKWMLAAASLVPNGIKHDESVLRLHPDPAGVQHDEQKGSFLPFGLRTIKSNKAVMHKSVYRRFAAGPVVIFDRLGLYRPAKMKDHVDSDHYFDWRDAEHDDARTLAEKFLVRFTRLAGQGEGWSYVYAGWYQRLLGLAERGWMPAVASHYGSFSFTKITLEDHRPAEWQIENEKRPSLPLPPVGKLQEDLRQ